MGRILVDKDKLAALESSVAEYSKTITTLRNEVAELKEDLEEEKARVGYLTKELSKERKRRLEALLIEQGAGKSSPKINAPVPNTKQRTHHIASEAPNRYSDSLNIQQILDLILRPMKDIEGWCIVHEVSTILMDIHSTNKIHGSVSLQSIRIDKAPKVFVTEDKVGTPELPKGEEITLKTDIYCLGAAIWQAADFLLEFDEEVNLSEELCSLLERMTSENAMERPTLVEIKKAAEPYAIQSRYVLTTLLQEIDRKKHFRKDIDKEFAVKHKNAYNDVLSKILQGKANLKPVSARPDKFQKIAHNEMLEKRKSALLLKSRLSGNYLNLLEKRSLELPMTEEDEKLRRQEMKKEIIKGIKMELIRETSKVNIVPNGNSNIPVVTLEGANTPNNQSMSSMELTRETSRFNINNSIQGAKLETVVESNSPSKEQIRGMELVRDTSRFKIPTVKIELADTTSNNSPKLHSVIPPMKLDPIKSNTPSPRDTPELPEATRSTPTREIERDKESENAEKDSKKDRHKEKKREKQDEKEKQREEKQREKKEREREREREKEREREREKERERDKKLSSSPSSPSPWLPLPLSSKPPSPSGPGTKPAHPLSSANKRPAHPLSTINSNTKPSYPRSPQLAPDSPTQQRARASSAPVQKTMK